MVLAWPRIISPLSAWFFSTSWRCSGVVSKTTPLPKIGVMNGYAAAWSSTESGARKKASLASAPGDQHDVAVGEPEAADVAALRRGRGAAGRSGRRAGPRGDRARTRGTGARPRGCRRRRSGSTVETGHFSSRGASGFTSIRFRCTPRGALTTVSMASASAAGLRKCVCRARPNLIHAGEHVGRPRRLPVAAHLAPGRAGPHDARPGCRSPRAPSASRAPCPRGPTCRPRRTT